jgi:hypothetical protein
MAGLNWRIKKKKQTALNILKLKGFFEFRTENETIE